MALALSVALALSGCASYEDRLANAPEAIVVTVSYVIHGDTNFSPGERSTIEWAASEWGRFTGGRARLKVVWDYTDVTYLELASKPHLRRLRVEDVPNSDTIAGWEFDAVNIALMPDRCPNLGACALHEFGHLVGLGHVAEENCVMSPWNPSSAFQAADRTECVRVGACSRLRKPDVTTVTLTVDPAIPRVEPEYLR